MVSREQALGYGFTDSGLSRQVGEGSWQRLASGIYVTSTGPASWVTKAWAGVLVGGDRARVGGLAAAHLHELRQPAPVPIEILVLGTARPRVDGPWVFRRESPGARSGKTVGSPPRLTVEDTVLDLVADPDCGTREAIDWIALAVGARRTTPERILRAAEQRHFLRQRQRQRQLLLKILDDVRVGVRSPLEHDYLHKVERAHDLPEGRRQIGRRRTEVDVLYVDFGLIVELDGKLGHEGVGRFRDMRRDNASTTDGLATLRYGKPDVFGSPCEVADEVGTNLMLRGWGGPKTRCTHCRRVA